MNSREKKLRRNQSMKHAGNETPGALRRIPKTRYQIKIQELVRPLVMDDDQLAVMRKARKASEEFRLMRHTSYAFTQAFTLFGNMDEETSRVLEERIPEKTSAAVALKAFNTMFKDTTGVAPELPRDIRRKLQRVGYGIVKSEDLIAGLHSHEEPHWYRVLEIMRATTLLLGRGDINKLEEGVKNTSPTEAGNIIKKAVIDATLM